MDVYRAGERLLPVTRFGSTSPCMSKLLSETLVVMSEGLRFRSELEAVYAIL